MSIDDGLLCLCVRSLFIELDACVSLRLCRSLCTMYFKVSEPHFDGFVSTTSLANGTQSIRNCLNITKIPQHEEMPIRFTSTLFSLP